MKKSSGECCTLPSETDILGQIVAPLLKWYGGHARILPWRESTEPYHVWVSEIMLQQTRVEAVIPYFERFLSALPTLSHLADAPEEQLLKLWEGLGYYNRVRNLQKAAQMIVSRFDDRFPTAYDDLLTLPGIGEYTAGAIASICFEQKTPAVDGNVMRVLTRVTANAADITKPAFKKDITAALREVYPDNHCGAFTQSLMELGATVCLPNGMPKCADCPLAPLCKAYQQDSVLLFPVKTKKKPRRIEERTVFVLTCGDKVAVRKRMQSGILAGLWEFPNMEGNFSEVQAIDLLKDRGFFPVNLIKSSQAKHIFTHIEWHMTGYFIECSMQTSGEGKENTDCIWVTRETLTKEIALPSAFRAFYNGLLET